MRVLKSKANGPVRELDIPAEDFRGVLPRELTAGELGVRELTVRSGVEVFSPVQFHKFEVGPVEAVLVLKSEDKLLAKYAEAEAMLERMVAHSFDKKLVAYLERVREVALKVEATRS